MDLHVLDDLLRSKELVDYYESLIWTERYSEFGDFELLIRSDRGTRALFPAGTRLAIDKSYRVMTVETVENSTNDDGVAMLKISGRSLETWLEDRTTRVAYETGLPLPSDWVLTGTPSVVATTIFDSRCRDNIAAPSDNLPFMSAGMFLTAGSIALPTESVTVDVKPASVYEYIKTICDVYDLGFRLIRNPANSLLYFDVYTGDDRTTLQTARPAVVFSPELENLSDPTDITSVAQFKNVAYVFAVNGTMIVYADGASSSTSGFARRVLIVNADDITLEMGSELNAAMTQRGKEELSKNRSIIAFDGELPKFGSYVYGTDYNLGDLVEIRNVDGLANNMRVTEQIFIEDAEGERSYPTLTIDMLITPGSWFAWAANGVWDNAVGYWEDA